MTQDIFSNGIVRLYHISITTKGKNPFPFLTKSQDNVTLRLYAVQLTEVDDHMEHSGDEPTVWAEPGIRVGFFCMEKQK